MLNLIGVVCKLVCGIIEMINIDTRILTDLQLCQLKVARQVRNRKRKVKLANRGEDIRWSVELDCWIWLPNGISKLKALGV